MKPHRSNVYALVIAGGEGTRFYPLSTPEKPKQFLELFGDASLLRHTFNRITKTIPPDKVLVATNRKHLKLVREQIPEINPACLIGEPVKKNTAPCIGLAARLVFAHDPEAVLCVFPADHHIGKEENFQELLKKAIAAAREHEKLITFGIPPSWPSTEYGYIKLRCPVENSEGPLFEVECFVEKPDVDRARDYLISGKYLWNSGMFVWKAGVVLKEIAAHQPKIHKALLTLSERSEPKGSNLVLKNGDVSEAAVNRYFDEVEEISIDYGVLERSKNVLVFEADFDWNDLGTFDALKRIARNGTVTLNKTLVGPHLSPGDCDIDTCQAQKFIGKPWGHEIVWAKTGDYVGKVLFVKKGHRLSYQYHEIKEETIFLMEGALALEYENGDGRLPGSGRKLTRLAAGESFHIPPKMKHRLIGITDCKVLEVSTSHLDDVVRLEDEYGRSSIAPAKK